MTSSLRRWLAAGVATLAIAGTATVASADQAKAKKLYDDGEKAYNLGQFDKSIELFTSAYEEWPEPAFLFNIAQAYRQAGNCKQALFFYKRFLSLKENDTKKPIKPEVKKDVEGRITELEDCVKRDLANKPPDQLDDGHGSNTSTGGTTTGGTTTGGTTTGGTTTGGTRTTGGTTTGGTRTTGGTTTGGTTTGGTRTTGGTTTGGTTTGGTTTGGTRVAGGGGEGEGEGDGGEGDGVTAVGEVQPKLLSTRVTVGASVIGAGKLKSTVAPAIALYGGYPLAINPKLELDLGAAIAFTTFPYGTINNSGDGSAAWTSLLADVGASYTVAPKIALRGDVGLGVLLFSGLKMNNPFTENGAEASGALGVFGFRVAASAEYAFTKNVVAEVTPFAFEYSPAPAHFKSDVSSLTTISFMAGVGYRM